MTSYTSATIMVSRYYKYFYYVKDYTEMIALEIRVRVRESDNVGVSTDVNSDK